MRRVISPRFAMRILENGGVSATDDCDAGWAENGRLELVDMTSMVWGRARYNCNDESHRDAAVEALFEMMRAPPLLTIKEDIFIVNYCS